MRCGPANMPPPSVETSLHDAETIMVGDLVLVEVLQGFRLDREFAVARHFLEGLAQTTLGGRELALAAVGNYRALRARGITVRRTIDTLIATRCIAEGWPLLYSDRDFDPFVAHLGLRAALAEA